MKKIVMALALMAAASFSFAEVTTGDAGDVKGNSGTTATTQSAQTQASNSSAVVSCLINCADQTSSAQLAADAARDVANINAGAKIRNTPSVSGPSLTSSNDTCMGSTSGSANAPGLGLSFGTTWTDANCKMLKNSRELWNMGMKAASMAIMCTDSLNREALELTGFECPQTTRDRKNTTTATSASTSNEPTDPIVRARMGLPAIK